MSPEEASQRWPERLHQARVTHWIAEGHRAGLAEIRGAFDVVTLARVAHPTLPIEEAVAALAPGTGPGETEAGGTLPAGPGTVHVLDRYRR
ncbi:MAG TPA: hypothetical protein VGM91_19230 [Conexibacter sp.]|jgi:hypothetical protein